MAARRQAGSGQYSTSLQRLRRPQAQIRTRSVGDENDNVSGSRNGGGSASSARRYTYAYLNGGNSGSNVDVAGMGNTPLSSFEGGNGKIPNGGNASSNDDYHGYVIYCSTWTYLCHDRPPAYPSFSREMPRPKFLSYQDVSVGDWQNFEFEIEKLRSSMRRTSKFFVMIPNVTVFTLTLMAFETSKKTIITSEMATTFAVLLVIFVMFGFSIVADSFVSQYVHHKYFHPELKRVVGQFQNRLSQHRACSPYTVSYHVVMGKNETDTLSASTVDDGATNSASGTTASTAAVAAAMVRASTRKAVLPITNARSRSSTAQNSSQENDYMKNWWNRFCKNPVATLAAPHWSYIEFRKSQQTATIDGVSTLVV